MTDYDTMDRAILRGDLLQLEDMLTGAQPHLSAKARRAAAIKVARSLLARAQALPSTNDPKENP